MRYTPPTTTATPGISDVTLYFLRRSPLIAGLLLIAGTLPARADTVVISAARMVDVLGGRVLEHPRITVTDGRITAVETAGSASGGSGGPGNSAAPLGGKGAATDATPAADVRHVDLPGLTLLPGLIDMHTHITSDPRYGGYRGLEFTDNFWTVVGVANAKKTLEAGFTTIRNVGSANYDDVAIKQGIEAGFVPGPRIVPATYAIGATGGHCDADEFPPSITASPGSSRSASSSSVWPVMAAGSISHAALGFSSFATKSARDVAPVAPSIYRKP